MTTLSELADVSNGTFDTFTDKTLPEGHFGATAFIDGYLRGYLLEGELGDSQAVVKGRFEYTSKEGELARYAFAGGGVTGGTPIGEITDLEETFAKMI